jgi:hypothetical protein
MQQMNIATRTLQQKGEVIDIIIVPLLLSPLPSQKNDEKQLPKLSSFQHILVKSGHSCA